jgi:hypothetical protein
MVLSWSGSLLVTITYVAVDYLREALFFFSLFLFFVFLPVYLDEMIPGMQPIHIMLFFIIPYLQVSISYNEILNLDCVEYLNLPHPYDLE